jgi:hypothetical protein
MTRQHLILSVQSHLQAVTIKTVVKHPPGNKRPGLLTFSGLPVLTFPGLPVLTFPGLPVLTFPGLPVLEIRALILPSP